MRTATMVAGMLATVAVTSVIALALAWPDAAPVAAVVRAVADCAAVGTLGLTIVPALETGRRRDELAAAAAGPLIVVSAAWVVAELVRQVSAAAQTAAVPMLQLPLRTVADLALQTVAGRAGLASACAAAVVCTVAVSGHLSENTWGALAVVVHALSAAAWCGGLLALAMTVRHRGQWARVLPRFSAMALICVTALLVSGLVSSLLATELAAQWYGTGYGRLLLAKLVLLIALVILGWRNRTVWLPAARAHRASAARSRSRSRSVVELALMVVALTLAAALAVTG